MQVADRIGDRELRLQVHVQRSMSQRSNIHQGHFAVSGVQGQGQIHRCGGGSAATFGVDHGKDFAPGSFPVHFSLRRGQPDESFQKIGSGGRTLNEFAGAGAHRADDYLGLGHAAHGKHHRVSHFLMDHFDGA